MMAMDDISNDEIKPLQDHALHSGHRVRRVRRKRKPEHLKKRPAKINPIHLLIIVALAFAIGFFIVSDPSSNSTPSPSSSDAPGT